MVENANKIFGFDGWDSSILHLSVDYVSFWGVMVAFEASRRREGGADKLRTRPPLRGMAAHVFRIETAITVTRNAMQACDHPLIVQRPSYSQLRARIWPIVSNNPWCTHGIQHINYVRTVKCSPLRTNEGLRKIAYAPSLASTRLFILPPCEAGRIAVCVEICPPRPSRARAC